MRKNAGFSVRIFLPTGEPEGLHIVEKSNWTGVGIVFPRVRFAEARQREELKRPGVYVLWGPGESGQLPRVYVGEGDTVLPRLEQHAKQKDFWMHAAVFTCKDTSLNKAHVKYLEARLVALAAEAKRAELDNGSIPQLPTLSEADQADCGGLSRRSTPLSASRWRELFRETQNRGRETPRTLLKSEGYRGPGSGDGRRLCGKGQLPGSQARGALNSPTSERTAPLTPEAGRARGCRGGLPIYPGLHTRFALDRGRDNPWQVGKRKNRMER